MRKRKNENTENYKAKGKILMFFKLKKEKYQWQN